MSKAKRAALVLSVASLLVGMLAAPAGAAPGAKNTQVSGDSTFDTPLCPGGLDLTPPQNGWGLDGCLTGFGDVDYRQSKGGVEKIGGQELFDGTFGYYENGSLVGPSVDGTFVTSFVITAKWNDDFSVQYHGRCQHPIVKGSGTDGFEGVEGRLDFKDVINDAGEATNFPYRGHLKVPLLPSA